MKILLTYISGAADRSDIYLNLLPSGVCYLHACLREAGHDSRLANFSGWSDAEIRRTLREVKPDVVGISQWTHNRHVSVALARLVRETLPDCAIIMGGGHATFRYRHLLAPDSPVDVVVLGEGEETLCELVHRLSGKGDLGSIPGVAYKKGGNIVVTDRRSPRADLDHIPMPARFLRESVGVDQELQAEFILSARGCPSACTFCSSPGFWGRMVRYRSPEHMVEELLYIRDQFGLIYFSIRDDTFTVNRERTIAFCRLLIERKAYLLWNCQSNVKSLDEELLLWMKRAGCECVQLGVESGSEAMLAQLGKGISRARIEQSASLVRRVGINLSVYLIADIPEEQEQDVQASMELLRRIRPDDGYVSPLAYYPGTALFARAVADGTVAEDVFEVSREVALYAARQPGSNSGRILQVLTASAPRNLERFRQQKAAQGFCYVTNVLAGTAYEQQGDFTKAAREYQEIIAREPGNPWGWFLQAELSALGHDRAKALELYRHVLRLVPGHGPSHAAMRAQKKRSR